MIKTTKDIDNMVEKWVNIQNALLLVFALYFGLSNMLLLYSIVDIYRSSMDPFKFKRLVCLLLGSVFGFSQLFQYAAIGSILYLITFTDILFQCYLMVSQIFQYYLANLNEKSNMTSIDKYSYMGLSFYNAMVNKSVSTINGICSSMLGQVTYDFYNITSNKLSYMFGNINKEINSRSKNTIEMVKLLLKQYNLISDVTPTEFSTRVSSLEQPLYGVTGNRVIDGPKLDINQYDEFVSKFESELRKYDTDGNVDDLCNMMKEMRGTNPLVFLNMQDVDISDNDKLDENN